MPYGYQPLNWPAFQRQLAERGLAVDDIEKVEIRPSAAAASAVIVTARSGDVHVWCQDEGQSA